MALRIMLLDMLKLRRRTKSRDIPIQIPQPPMNGWIAASDIPDITLEVLHIHWIEPDYRRIQADVGFGDVFAEIKGLGVLGQVFFDAIEGAEEGLDGFFVGGLGGGEAGFVDAIVDVVVGPVIGAFDFGLEVFGEEVDFAVLRGNNVVKLGVEHADDFA